MKLVNIKIKMEPNCPSCIICRRDCDKYDGKEWIKMRNEKYFETHLPIIHYCSYLCFERNRHRLPPNHWNHVLNKEDFNCPLPSIHSKDKEFEYLTYGEYIHMNDTEKMNYDSQKERNEINGLNSNSFYQEQYEEDKRTYVLENVVDEEIEEIDDY